jgi:hypothetical protein
MPRFEVYIPAAAGSGTNVTVRVDAENWMAALKTGFYKLGEQGFQMHNVMVDIQDDNSLHVTETSSGRVFRIRELSDLEVAQAEPKKPALPPMDVPTEQALRPSRPSNPSIPALGAAPAAAPATAATAQAKPAFVPPRVAPAPGLPPMRPVTPSPLRRGKNVPSAVIELEKPVSAVRGTIGRARTDKSAQEKQVDVLFDVFERVSSLQSMKSAEEGLSFLIDLAMEKIPSESASVLRANLGTGDLTFAAARGPKANELLQARFTVPAGTGIAGFCASEGVSVALSDVQKDTRHYSVVADRVNYTPRSLLCSPMMVQGRAYGAMQLINRGGGSNFTEYEVGLLSYIAHQAAVFLSSHY